MNETLVSAVAVISLTHKNRLILILCFWLLKKTLVITTNLTNPESAPDFGVSAAGFGRVSCSVLGLLGWL